MNNTSREAAVYKVELLRAARRAKELHQRGYKFDEKARPIRAALRAQIELQNAKKQAKEVRS